jgi:hypothetical protein
MQHSCLEKLIVDGYTRRPIFLWKTVIEDSGLQRCYAVLLGLW